MHDPQVLIVGAGIAGLALGRSLLSRGISAEIVERATRRVVLVGDAAHATSPNMAQGASMALEDALILTGTLASACSPIEALAAFAVRRRSRINWVKQRTHRRDRIRRLPALLRNLSLRFMGSAIYEADYRPLFDEP